MYPHERSLVKKLAGKPFALIGVNSDKDLDALQGVLKEENISWRSFWNGPDGTGGPISTQWNVSGWPTIYVLDADGKIRFKGVRGKSLDSAIEELMAEAGHEIDLSKEAEDHDADSKDSDGGDSDEGKNPEPPAPAVPKDKAV